jgi:hypothetical protein
MMLPVILKLRLIGMLFLVLVSGVWMSESYAKASTPTPTPTPTPAECQRLNTTTVVSPNKTWDAVVHEDACEFGYAFTANALYTVTILSASNPKEHEDVFCLEDHGNPAQEPIASWISNSALQINTIKSVEIGLQESTYKKIAISYVYRS